MLFLYTFMYFLSQESLNRKATESDSGSFKYRRGLIEGAVGQLTMAKQQAAAPSVFENVFL